MCGIAGYYRKSEGGAPVNTDKLLSSLLGSIDHRGGDATGYVSLGQNGEAFCQKAACDVLGFERERFGLAEGTRSFLAHTRFATQGNQAFPENNHPIRRGSFYIVHNGHIYNDDQVFDLAERERFGRVDSEAIAAIIAHYKGDVAKAMSELLGDAAVGILDQESPNVLTVARGAGSPLHVLETRRSVIFASTAEACTRAHIAGIGSLGRAKPEAIEEGTVITWIDGQSSRETFPVKRWTPKYTTTKATPIGNAWSGKGNHWLDSDDLTDDEWEALYRGWKADAGEWDDDDDDNLGDHLREALDASRARCDSCDELLDLDADEAEEVFDGSATWTLCDSCADLFCAEDDSGRTILPVTLETAREWATWDGKVGL